MREKDSVLRTGAPFREAERPLGAWKSGRVPGRVEFGGESLEETRSLVEGFFEFLGVGG